MLQLQTYQFSEFHFAKNFGHIIHTEYSNSNVHNIYTHMKLFELSPKSTQFVPSEYATEYDGLCFRSRHQGQGQVITSYGIRGM